MRKFEITPLAPICGSRYVSVGQHCLTASSNKMVSRQGGGGQVSMTFLNLCFLLSQKGLKVSASDDCQNLDKLSCESTWHIQINSIHVGFFSKSQFKIPPRELALNSGCTGFTWAAFKKYGQTWTPFWLNWSEWGLGISIISKLPADSHAEPGLRTHCSRRTSHSFTPQCSDHPCFMWCPFSILHVFCATLIITNNSESLPNVWHFTYIASNPYHNSAR